MIKKIPLYSLVLALLMTCPFLAAQSEDSEEQALILPDTEGLESSESSADEQSTSDEEELFVVQPEFTVSAENDQGYYSANSISATRTNALVKNTPITVSVVNEELMEDLNIQNDQDLVRASASVTRDPDGFSLNQLRIRGFRSLTQRYDLFWREIERDGYNIQRVDIVKGANSLIYGQADPGGQINSVPKKAQIGNDFSRFEGTIGNKDYIRGEFDGNYTLSDELAVRIMGVDLSRERDQMYELIEKRGATLEATYRPTKKTELRAHIEMIKLDQNLAPNMFRSTNNDSRFEANSPQDNSEGSNDSFTLGTYRNEYIYSQDAVEFIPQAIINDLELDPNYAAQLGVDPNNVTRSVLEKIYAPWASQDDLYSVTGPDKYNRREGLVTTLDWTQEITDDIQAKIAINREDDDRKSRARDGYSAGRVMSDASGPRAFEPYVETYWRRQDGTTEANALKSTLNWNVEPNVDIPVIRDSEHKLLFGADWDHLKRNPKMYEQVQEGTELKEGGYYRRTTLNDERFYLSDGFGPDVPNIRYNGRDDLFVLRQDNEFESHTQSLWFAAQSSFFDGRLRSLVGLRYDNIDIDYSIKDYKYAVNDNFVQNQLGGDYSRAATRIEDENNKYDQFSPSIGALYWLNDDVAVFANYAESIQSPTSLQVDPLGDIIPPVYGEGYEYGLRFELLDGKLNGQITAFYIEKINDNIVNYDFRLNDIYTYEKYGQSHPQIFNPNNQRLNNNLLPGKNVPGDVSRSEGVEVEFHYNPNDNLSFILSYAYTNLDAIEINENVNPRFAQVFGQAPHNLLLIGRYQFKDGPLKGLVVGANQTFRSKSTIGQWYIEGDGDAPGQGEWYDIEFDPEFVTDVFVRYQTRLGSGRSAPRLNVGLRVNNVFDDTDLIQRNTSAYHRNSRQFLLHASLKF